jgi:hypothetical protein
MRLDYDTQRHRNIEIPELDWFPFSGPADFYKLSPGMPVMNLDIL